MSFVIRNNETGRVLHVRMALGVHTVLLLSQPLDARPVAISEATIKNMWELA